MSDIDERMAETYFIYDKLLNFEKRLDKLPEMIEAVQGEDLLTRQKAMQLLDVGSATLDRWSRQGLINRYGIGGRVYFKKSEIINSLIKI